MGLLNGVLENIEFEFSFSREIGEKFPFLSSEDSESSFSDLENLISNFIMGKSISGFCLIPCGANVLS